MSINFLFRVVVVSETAEPCKKVRDVCRVNSQL